MKKKITERAKRNGIAVILAILFVSLFTVGCSDEDFEEYEEIAEDEEYEDDEEYLEDEESEDDKVTTERYFLSEEDYPRGTGATLDGKIVVVSIFLNDNTTSWDFNSQEDLDTIMKLSYNMGRGMDWITEQGKKYGKDIEFIYDWDADNELFYSIDIDCDFSTGGAQIADVKILLDENFAEVSNKLLDKYDTEQIIYAMYLNEASDTKMTCHAMPFRGTDLGYDIPYEAICLTNWVYESEQGPATSAHEILHLFGAPDYYLADKEGDNFDISQDFVDYCQNCDLVNEIMFSTYDPYTDTIPKDEVTNDLSELTAYYVGWTDEIPDLIKEFGLSEKRL